MTEWFQRTVYRIVPMGYRLGMLPMTSRDPMTSWFFCKVLLLRRCSPIWYVYFYVLTESLSDLMTSLQRAYLIAWL